jgi:hypothetical protein
MTFNTTKDERGTMMTGAPQKLFGDNILPIPVPKR